MNQRYTTIATSDMVSMVYDEGDDNNVLSFEAIQNGDETTLNVQFIDKSSGKNPNDINSYTVYYYTSTILTDTLTGSNFGYVIKKGKANLTKWVTED